MINPNRVDTAFTQARNSCVLASYAIAYNYFTGEAIAECFESYCRHFNLQFNGWREAEGKYVNHFHIEWTKRGCTGYELILDLHRTSPQSVFTKARIAFNGSFYPKSTIAQADLENFLRTQESMLNLTYDVDNNYHSVIIIHDGTMFRIRDTANNDLKNLQKLSDLGSLRDSVLWSAITK